MRQQVASARVGLAAARPMPADEDGFRQLVEMSVQGVLVHRDFAPLYANAACARIFGAGGGEAVAGLRSVLPLFRDPALVEARTRELLGAPAGRRGTRLVCEATRLDGAAVWLDMLMQPVRWRGGGAVQCLIADVTERRRFEERRRRLQTELLEGARLSAMREVLDAMGHRLNQPRAAMLNYANALRRMLPRADLPETAAEAIGKMIEQADRISRIVREVEELVSDDPARRTPQDINALIAEIGEAAAAEAAAEGVALRLDLDRRLPAACFARDQIREVVFELLRRAIRRAASGEAPAVLVRTRRTGGARVAVEIRPGLAAAAPPPERSERPESPFLRVIEAVIEAHGGRLRGPSEAEGGRGFTFELPLAG